MDKVFRISIIKSFYFSIPYGIALFIVSLVGTLINFFSKGISQETVIEGLIISFAPSIGILLFLTFLIFFLGIFFPVRVYGNQISATNYWGKRHIFTWNELNSAELADASGVTYLVFSNQNEKKIWIPLLIGELDSFIDFVLEKTESLNPDFYITFLDIVNGEEATE